MGRPGSVPGSRPKRRFAASLASRTVAVGTGGDDGCGTAIHQHFQLLLRIPSCRHLAFHLPHVPGGKPAAARHLVHEESHAEKSGEIEQVAWQPGIGAPGKLIERLRQPGADGGNRGDFPTGQGGADHQHGRQIKKAERDLRRGMRIDSPQSTRSSARRSGSDVLRVPHTNMEKNGISSLSRASRLHSNGRVRSPMLWTIANVALQPGSRL